MGGIVATSLLPHPNISTIITMSTPHTLPPARFDARIDSIYALNKQVLEENLTPILSLCGGATDSMVPSESCILPASRENVYRRTVFSSALEGSWTGVGHQEMVWCHQVRWRVARAALEIGAASSPEGRGEILDTWLRDGSALPPALTSSQHVILDISLRPGQFVTLPENQRLELKSPTVDQIYLLPVPKSDTSNSKFVLYLSQGSISPTAPQRPLPLRVTVRTCHPDSSGEDAFRCTSLTPSTLKLVPNPLPGRPFPVPGEGSDESEGVVFFEADINVSGNGNAAWVAVSVEGGDGRGWVVGGFVQAEVVVSMVNSFAPFLSTVSIDLSEDSISTKIHLPTLLSHVLIVYRLTPRFSSPCTESLLLPLLQHTSHPSETHYFSLSLPPPRKVLLHTHASAPYITPPAHGFNLSIYSSGECRLSSVEVTVDLWGTLGRWGMRYWSAVLSWSVALVASLIFDAWSVSGDAIPSVEATLYRFVKKRLAWFIIAAILISLIPLPVGVWFGNAGEPMFVLIAPFLMAIVTGLVCVSWWILMISMWAWRAFARILPFGRSSSRRLASTSGNRRNWIVSMAIVFLAIFLIVPWQVAFLGCWIFQFYTCITASKPAASSPSSPSAIPLMPQPSDSPSTPTPPFYEHRSPIESTPHQNRTHIDLLEQENQSNEYLLLLMTWLLPLAAPVLAVWVRTLATAGLTTPFDGDHNVLYVAPFILLLDLGPVAAGFLGSRGSQRGWLSPRWAFLVFSRIALLFGPRWTYVVFYAASAALGILLMLELVPQYWTSWRVRYR
ncbi:unnamed protein product [Somion occarium]